ncbi:MAG: shikimate kinase [Acholeplasmataceae bacterium]
MNIYLIGMPGSGKSTVARALAAALGRPMIDLDARIEEDALMFIDEIFSIHGEETFRELETQALKGVAKQNAVISCGGGIVENSANRSYMEGIVIYLKCRIDTLEERLKNGPIRPLLHDKPLILLERERSDSYEAFADLIVTNDGTVEGTVENIRNLIKERKGI